MISARDAVALVVASEEARRHVTQLGPTPKWTSGFGLGGADSHETLVRGLQQAQLFDADNVVGWVADGSLTEGEFFRMLTDLPCCTPPYPFSYLEWDDQGIRFSALVFCAGVYDKDITKQVSIFCFDTVRPGETYLLGSAHLDLDRDGRTINHQHPGSGLIPRVEMRVADLVRKAVKDEKTGRMVAGALGRAVGIALFFFSLLHCTNVKAVPVDPRDGMNRQQLREAERRKRALLVYHRIVLKPFGSYRKSKADPDVPGRIHRLHMVRGHFAEYGPDYDKGLLFGRIAGRFYVAPHVRGDLDQGVVGKSYALAPKASRGDVWMKS